jgi:hypothetical protein
MFHANVGFTYFQGRIQVPDHSVCGPGFVSLVTFVIFISKNIKRIITNGPTKDVIE